MAALCPSPLHPFGGAESAVFIHQNRVRLPVVAFGFGGVLRLRARGVGACPRGGGGGTRGRGGDWYSTQKEGQVK